MKQCLVFIFAIYTTISISSCGGNDPSIIKIGGHIELMDGMPVPNIAVSILDPATNNYGSGPHYVYTNVNRRFYHEIGGSEAGTQIIVEANDSNYSFSPTQYIFNLPSTERLDLDFVADPI